VPSRYRDSFDFKAALPAKTRRALLAAASRLGLPAGTVLFRQGDEADAIYLLESGTLGVYVARHGIQALVALIRPGEIIGEMAVAARIGRSATVSAIRDCELLRLTPAAFRRLTKKHKAIHEALVQVLAHRLRRTISSEPPVIEPRITAFLAASRDIEPGEFAHELAHHMRRQGFGTHVVGPGDLLRGEQTVADLEARHEHLFLAGSEGNEECNRLCVRQADRLVALARAESAPGGGVPRDLFDQRADHQLADIVILHDRPRHNSSHTARWLDALHANRHFHLRRETEEDWQRLARIIAGRATGLVLSGGGARAYAHLGAVKALNEAGIPIDFIGGASMGGIVAACIAMDWSIEESVARIRRAFVDRNPLRDYSLPLFGLVRGRWVERLLNENFGSTLISDLWRPFFCVSSNLTTAEVEVHRRGKVAEALRSSVSLPGILPPVANAKGVLVDGGVMDNLPVDVMRSLNNGPVIAVDVARDLAITPQWLAKMRSSSLVSRLLRPPLISILMRAGTVASEFENRQQIANADLAIVPRLGEIDIRNWTAFEDAVDIGYRATVAALETPQAKALVTPRRGG
jgi:NTE family protein